MVARVTGAIAMVNSPFTIVPRRDMSKAVAPAEPTC